MTQKKEKKALLKELYAPYQKCTLCSLGKQGRKHVVFGEGDTNAKLMFIGEGPGKEEDLLGKPFVGRSGKLLDKTLELTGLKREQVFITNVVKCRPPGNRKPLPIESKTCKKLLLFKQIETINPKLICTLGSSALEALIEQPIKITTMRGKIIKQNNMTILPTYHPAYILRNRKELENFANDIKKAVNFSKT